MLIPGWRPLSLLGLRPTGDLGPLTCYTSKRGRTVWFQKSPPLKPPSPRQISQRNKLRLNAELWRSLDQDQRDQWSLAEKRGSLVITGYNLFVWWSLGGDPNVIKTIERQTDSTLIPVPAPP